MKFILIVFFGLILVGCSEDKTTDKMFVGDWSCNFVEYKATYENKKFDDYIKINEIEKINFKIKYENKKLYSLKEGDDNWKEGSIINEYNNQTTLNESDSLLFKQTKLLLNATKNQFTTSDEVIVTPTAEKDHVFYSKNKFETICTRIK